MVKEARPYGRPSGRTAATREALGPPLVRLARSGLDIVVVDADLGVSTSAAKFGAEFPDRFFTVGVAEQNMIGVAAGLAAPRDVVEAEQAIEAAARSYGPFYIRTVRPKVPVIYEDGYRFELGRWHLLRPGSEVTVIAVGVLVKAALDAAGLLAADGVDCRRLDAGSLQPAATDAILPA